MREGLIAETRLSKSYSARFEGSVQDPRHSAREVTLAIEPALEIVELQSAEFHGNNAKAWFCLSRKRTMPAQPSTLHD